MTNAKDSIPTGIDNRITPSSANTHNTRHLELEPISPSEAIEMYLSDRSRELRSSSLESHKSALNFFERWCDEQEIDNLNELTGRLLHQYRIWRRDDATVKVDTLSKKSEKSQQDIIRTFIEYCESIDAVRPRLHEQVRSPTIPRDEAAREVYLDSERATDILDWLRKYEYASVEHVVWILFTDHGPRTGALHSTDIDDYHPNGDPPHIEYRHRPETGTELKKGTRGERLVAISERVRKVLDEYIDNRRPEVTDSFGRKPLLTAGQGRLSKSTIRKYVYKWTRPCEIGKKCPKDRNEETCEAIVTSAASKCPLSRSAHTIRRGYITHELNAGVDRSYVSGRCDVSEDIIKLHYDERDEHERLQARHRHMREAHQNEGNYGGGR